MPINPEDDMERSAPQTESAQERGFNVKTDNREYGAADHDPEGTGDIADEGPGHRDVAPFDYAQGNPEQRRGAPTGHRTPGSAEGERDRSDQSK